VGSLTSVLAFSLGSISTAATIAGSLDGWHDMFKLLQGNAESANARVDWRTMTPTSEELFNEIEELTADTFRKYRDSANALLSQATKIRDSLDRAIRRAG